VLPQFDLIFWPPEQSPTKRKQPKRLEQADCSRGGPEQSM